MTLEWNSLWENLLIYTLDPSSHHLAWKTLAWIYAHVPLERALHTPQPIIARKITHIHLWKRRFLALSALFFNAGVQNYVTGNADWKWCNMSLGRSSWERERKETWKLSIGNYGKGLYEREERRRGKRNGKCCTAFMEIKLILLIMHRRATAAKSFFFACSRDYYYAQTGFCFLFALVFPVLIRNKFLFLFSLPFALFVNR